MKIWAYIQPTIKRLMGKRRRVSTVCLCVTLIISVALLSSLSLSFANHLQGLDALRVDYDAYVNATGHVSAEHPFRLAVREILQGAMAEIVATHILLLLLWLLLSVAGVGLVLSEAVGCETYIYALYVIYGADPRLMRKQIYAELGVVGVPSLLLGFLISWCVVSHALGSVHMPTWVILEVVGLCGMLCFLSAAVITRRMFKQTCVKLLNHADTSAYIHSPRRSQCPRYPHRQGGLYYASLSFVRMRKYHLPRGLALCLVAAVLFVLSGLTLPDIYATQEEVHELTLSMTDGVDGKTLNNEYLPMIEYCEGVVSAKAVAGDEAYRLGTHILLEEDQLKNIENHAIYTGDMWAFDSLKIACADGDTYTELGGNMILPSPYDQLLGGIPELTGYPLDAIPAGKAVYVYPIGTAGAGLTGQFVDISLPDGVEGYDRYGEHITVEVIAAVEVTHLKYQPDPLLPFTVDLGPRITEDYLFISPQDYGALLGETYAHSAEAIPAMSKDMNLSAGECYLLLPMDTMEEIQGLDVLTLITPESPFLEPFSDGRIPAEQAKYLPMDTYAINKTIHQTGIYLGSKAEFLGQEDAVLAMSQCIAGKTTADIYPMVCNEYQIVACRGVDGWETPCVVFSSDEHTTFATWGEEVTSLVLSSSVILETDDTIIENTDPDDLPLLESENSRLYFAAYEGVVLQTDGVANIGDVLYMGTDVPTQFCQAMQKAEISLTLPQNQYQLTKGYVGCVFGLPNRGNYMVWYMAPNSNLAMDHYPKYLTGVNDYFPIGDTTKDSIISPSERDIMLVAETTTGQPPKENATWLTGKWAYHEFLLWPDFEVQDIGSLSQGQAIWLLPADKEVLSVEDGDMVQLGIYQPLSLAWDDPLLYQMDPQTLLQIQLDTLNHDYHGVKIIDVRISQDVTKPTLVLAEDDFCCVLDRDGAVTSMDIYVDAKISLTALSETYDTLTQIGGSLGGMVEMHGRVLRSQATGTSYDVKLLHTMLYLLVWMIPILLLSSTYALGLRRKEEWQAFVAAGGTKGRHISMCLWEGGLKCLLYGFCYVLLCPMVTLFAMLVGGKLHMPFLPEIFSVSNGLWYLLVLLISVALTSLIPLLQMPMQFKKRRHKKTSMGGDGL